MFQLHNYNQGAAPPNHPRVGRLAARHPRGRIARGYTAWANTGLQPPAAVATSCRLRIHALPLALVGLPVRLAHHLQGSDGRQRVTAGLSATRTHAQDS